MGGRSYIAANLTGAWQVMLGRPDGLARIDTSLEGFWRSFAVLALIAPLTLIALISQDMLASVPGCPPEPLTAGRLALETVALLVDWIAFPLVFAALAKPFGLASRYVPFIVTRNWSSLIISAMVAVMHGAHLLGVLPSALLPYVLLAVVAVALRFSYVIARTTLAVSIGMALPIVILDFLISMTIWSAFERIAA